MKISIVIINYNDKIRIERSIESALNQTNKNVEVIVVDDGSDQETRDIYKKYNDKVKLIQLERDDKSSRTPSRARNEGIKYANGDFICFLDSDNYLDFSFVDTMVKHDKDVMFCNWDIVGIENYKVNIEKVWDFKREILQNYLQYTHLDHQCLLIRKSYLDKIGLYDTRLPRSQDCDMIVRLILGGGTWAHVQDCLFHFEKHEEDQMKVYASIHGKTLWSLKNNLNIRWLLSRMSDPLFILAYKKGIDDFCMKEEWKEDFNKSEFKLLVEKFEDIFPNEIKEKVLNAKI
jgi:glycosyltransferase involved in cell wall biosynthesis